MDSGVLKQFSFFVELTNFVFVHVDVCMFHALICMHTFVMRSFVDCAYCMWTHTYSVMRSFVDCASCEQLIQTLCHTLSLWTAL